MTWENRIVGQGTEAPDQLMANPKNWRVHPKHQQAVLEGALNEIGWVQNVIVNKTTGHIVDGHLRVHLAMQKHVEQVPVVYVELTEAEEDLALATLDPISQLATTDQEILRMLMADLDTENADILSMLDGLVEGEDDLTEETGNIEDDEVPEFGEGREPISKPGDLWQLGDHWLICGDSTKPEDIGRLMQAGPADLVWMDPPYNVDYEGSDGQKIQNDKMEDGQFRQFLRDAFIQAANHTRAGGPIYIAHADSEGYNFRGAMVEAGFLLKQTLIWVKNSFTLGRQDYQWQHEPILYGWKAGAGHSWYGAYDKSTVVDWEKDPEDMTEAELRELLTEIRRKVDTTVIREAKPKKNGEHPTMKPVKLITRMLRNSGKRGSIVLDLFGGSGSTLIAAQKIGMKARLAELDPKYCDVIINRWQEFTGEYAMRHDGELFDTLDAKASV